MSKSFRSTCLKMKARSSSREVDQAVGFGNFLSNVGNKSIIFNFTSLRHSFGEDFREVQVSVSGKFVFLREKRESKLLERGWRGGGFL